MSTYSQPMQSLSFLPDFDRVVSIGCC